MCRIQVTFSLYSFHETVCFTEDKEAVCATLGHAWMKIKDGEGKDVAEHKTPLLLPKCAGYLRLTMKGDVIDVGGHDVVLCQVLLVVFFFSIRVF